MENPYFKVKRLSEEAILPSKRDEDAGYDLYGIFDEDFLILDQGDIKLVGTKLSIEISKNWVFYIAERGSTGTKGISRRCGVIDSGYRGEIFIPINNTSNKKIVFYRFNDSRLDEFLNKNNLNKNEITIYPYNKAIAQGMLLYTPHVEIEEVKELSNSIRGSGVIGSSNK